MKKPDSKIKKKSKGKSHGRTTENNASLWERRIKEYRLWATGVSKSEIARQFKVHFDTIAADLKAVAMLEPVTDAVSKIVTAQEIPDNWMGLDIGPATVRLYREGLNDVQTVLWNGPMGVYEMDKFARGSSKIAHFVADSYATTVVGGGDTADLVQRIGLDEEISFISTGGGASLELLEGKILPGVAPLIIQEG